MKALAAMLLITLLAGCSVNVIVAPHAVLAVDSNKDKGDTTNMVFPGTEFELE